MPKKQTNNLESELVKAKSEAAYYRKLSDALKLMVQGRIGAPGLMSLGASQMEQLEKSDPEQFAKLRQEKKNDIERVIGETVGNLEWIRKTVIETY